MKVRVGMEASGHARWFERLLAELNFELWIGDAAVIRTKQVRKQESVIAGVLSAVQRDADGRRVRRVSTRRINGIDQDVRLNRPLWELAAKMG